MTQIPLKLVAFDLDGTLLNANKMVSATDMAMLNYLGQKGICRVACTGRNLYSITKLFPPQFPFDYVVFSTGAGVYHWAGKTLLTSWLINKPIIEPAVNLLTQTGYSFTLNLPIPDNHYMLWHQGQHPETDLLNYTAFYKPFVSMLDLNHIPHLATQFIVLLPTRTHFDKLAPHFGNVKMILTTSPVNHSSYWLELFNPAVSKGHGLNYLCQLLNINPSETFGIGNDFNDDDMLQFTAHSFVVDNAPTELKQKYKTTASHNNSGFSVALNTLI